MGTHLAFLVSIYLTSNLNKHVRIPKGQSKMDNSEKLAHTQNEEKQNKNTTLYMLETTTRKKYKQDMRSPSNNWR